VRITSKIKGAVFDFDGTLVQSTAVKDAGFYSVYKKYGIEIAQAVLEHSQFHGGLNRYDKLRHYNTEFLGLPYSETLIHSQAKEFSKYVVDSVISACEVPGATEFLDHCLANGLLCAINSATPATELRHIVSRRRWGSRFDLVLGSPSTKYDNLCYTCEKWKLKATSLLFFGDAREDRLAAAKAGVRFVAIGDNTGDTIYYSDFYTYMRREISEL